MSETEFLVRGPGARLAYNRLEGPKGAPGVVFLHGLMSDRGGTKAMALEGHCRAKGYNFVRFDMSGHGASSGRFEDGTLSRWTEDACAVLDALTTGPQILVGSSMGGWVMLRTARARSDKVAGLVGIAAAPDFTEEIWAQLSPAQRSEMERSGIVHVQSDYDERPYPISHGLITDGRACCLLGAPVDIRVPVRLLQGQRDTSVAWQTPLKIADALTSEDVDVLLVKDGDHRLSRPQDLAKLTAAIDELVQVTA